VKERPILFSGEMVRIILEGRKLQTRRVIKPQLEPKTEGGFWWRCKEVESMVDEKALRGLEPQWDGFAGCVCPYGRPGDRLWVRETWARYEPYPVMGESGKLGLPIADLVQPGNALWEYWRNRLVYRADSDNETPAEEDGKGAYDDHWRPSIFMPRWASRIVLEITRVRVERIQEISQEDAKAEGRQCVAHFHETWDRLNARRGFGWDVNPWVWAIEFRRLA
jgi:hypothetical protein